MNENDHGINIVDRFYKRGTRVEHDDGNRFVIVNDRVTPRWQAGSVSISIKAALEFLECTDAAKAVGFRCDHECDLLGKIHRKKKDGRKYKMARNIQRQGSDYRVSIPPKAIEHQPYTKEELKNGEAEFDVWAIDDPEIIKPFLAITPHVVVRTEVELPPMSEFPGPVKDDGEGE